MMRPTSWLDWLVRTGTGIALIWVGGLTTKLATMQKEIDDAAALAPITAEIESLKSQIKRMQTEAGQVGISVEARDRLARLEERLRSLEERFHYLEDRINTRSAR